MRPARQDTATTANPPARPTGGRQSGLMRPATVAGRISPDCLRSRHAHPDTAYRQQPAHPVGTPRRPRTGRAHGPRPIRPASPCPTRPARSPRANTPASAPHNISAAPFQETGQIPDTSPGTTKTAAGRTPRTVQPKDRTAPAMNTQKPSRHTPPPSAATSQHSLMPSTRT